MDPNKLKDLFLSEAEDILQKIDDALLRLEKNPGDKKLLEEIMRAAHTLKSSSAAMGYAGITAVMHAMENIFDASRRDALLISGNVIDILFAVADELKESADLIKKSGKEVDMTLLIGELEKISGKIPDVEKPPGKIGASIKTTEIIPSEKISYVKVPVSRLDALMNIMEELLVGKMSLLQVSGKIGSEELQRISDHINLLLSDLQYQITQSRLVPVGQIFARFPRMVRDMAKEKNKEADLKMAGENMELDRSIVDKLAEPITHLVRNAIDHGIGDRGVIKISAVREKDYAVITVEDDGRGIDWEKIIATAKNRSLISDDKAEELKRDLSLGHFAAVNNLLFNKGVSTKEEVTETSGRGVGLSVVRVFAEEVGGRAGVESPIQGGGSRFTLELPITLAIINALVVACGGRLFAVPFSNIDRSIKIPQENIKRAADRDVAVVGGYDIPLVGLREIFNLPEDGDYTTRGSLVVAVKRGGEKIGIVVDEVVSEQEIAVKPLPPALRGLRGFSGSFISGDGRPILILDTNSLFDGDGKILTTVFSE